MSVKPATNPFQRRWKEFSLFCTEKHIFNTTFQTQCPSYTDLSKRHWHGEFLLRLFSPLQLWKNNPGRVYSYLNTNEFQHRVSKVSKMTEFVSVIQWELDTCCRPPTPMLSSLHFCWLCYTHNCKYSAKTIKTPILLNMTSGVSERMWFLWFGWTAALKLRHIINNQQTKPPLLKHSNSRIYLYC